MPRSLTHHPNHLPLFSRSCPHERRNMRSVWPIGTTAWGCSGRSASSSLTLNGCADRVVSTECDFLDNATSIRQTGSAVDEIFAEFDYNANGLMTSVKRYEVDGNNLINEIAESLYEYNSNNGIVFVQRFWFANR